MGLNSVVTVDPKPLDNIPIHKYNSGKKLLRTPRVLNRRMFKIEWIIGVEYGANFGPTITANSPIAKKAVSLSFSVLMRSVSTAALRNLSIKTLTE